MSDHADTVRAHIFDCSLTSEQYDECMAALAALERERDTLRAAFAQACMNLAVIRPGGRDLSIGEIADLYRDALLAGWGGIEGWPPEGSARDEESV